MPRKAGWHRQVREEAVDVAHVDPSAFGMLGFCTACMDIEFDYKHVHRQLAAWKTDQVISTVQSDSDK